MKKINILIFILALSVSSRVYCDEETEETEKKGVEKVDGVSKEIVSTILDILKKSLDSEVDEQNDIKNKLEKYDPELTKIKNIFRDMIYKQVDIIMNSSVKLRGNAFWSLLIPSTFLFSYLCL